MRTISHRIPALDQARGLAVLLMIAIHLIPVDGDGSRLGNWASAFSAFSWDKCAGTFCVVAGMTWSLQQAPLASTLRRAFALAALGLLLWLTLWPTEILTPLSIMMLCTLPWRRAPLWVLAATIAILLAATPLVGARYFDLGWDDWNENGLHHAQVPTQMTLANLVRYFGYSGNYPLLPWLAFPLLGQLLLPVVRSSRATTLGFAVAVIATAALHSYRCYSDNHWEQLPTPWIVNGSPTTIPYWALEASSAITLILGFSLLGRSQYRRFAAVFSDLGRASLTHYLLHIALAFWPLKILWPDEDWSASVGLMAFGGYLVFAIVSSSLWFNLLGKQRGPVEQLWFRVR